MTEISGLLTWSLFSGPIPILKELILIGTKFEESM